MTLAQLMEIIVAGGSILVVAAVGAFGFLIKVTLGNLKADHTRLSGTVDRLDGVVRTQEVAFAKMEAAAEGQSKLLDVVNQRVGDVLKVTEGQHDRVREDIREVLRRIDHRKRGAEHARLHAEKPVQPDTWDDG